MDHRQTPVPAAVPTPARPHAPPQSTPAQMQSQQQAQPTQQERQRERQQMHEREFQRYVEQYSQGQPLAQTTPPQHPGTVHPQSLIQNSVAAAIDQLQRQHRQQQRLNEASRTPYMIRIDDHLFSLDQVAVELRDRVQYLDSNQERLSRQQGIMWDMVLLLAEHYIGEGPREGESIRDWLQRMRELQREREGVDGDIRVAGQAEGDVREAHQREPVRITLDLDMNPQLAERFLVYLIIFVVSIVWSRIVYQLLAKLGMRILMYYFPNLAAQ